jgi:hypothetical protein
MLYRVEVERENSDGLGRFVWRFHYRSHPGRLELEQFRREMRASKRHKFKVTAFWSAGNWREVSSDLWGVPRLTREDVGLTDAIAREARDRWLAGTLAGGVEGIIEVKP